MIGNRMWFGTRERMQWVKCPNSGMGMNRVGWGATGTYLNGGGWSRRSATTHFEPNLTWSFLNHMEIRDIQDYYLGLYGPGPIYWLDPFAATTNTLPAHWSLPRLAAEDAPPLVKGQRPTLSDTPNNSIGLPPKMATYAVSSLDESAECYIPIPPKHRAWVAAWGSSSGGTVLRLRRDTSETGTELVRQNLLTNPSAETSAGTVEVRRNLIPNPSFETGTSGLLASGTTITTTTYAPMVISGTQAAAIVCDGGPAAPYQIFDGIGGGDWVGIRIPLRWSAGSHYYRLRIIYRDADDEWLPSPTSPYYYGYNGYANPQTFISQAPEGTVSALARIYFYDDEAASPPAAETTWSTDQWVAVKGSSEAHVQELLDLPYFDGDTSPDPDFTPSWTGAAHASESILTGQTLAAFTPGSTSLNVAVRSTRWAASGASSVRLIPIGASTTTYSVVGGASSSAMNNGMVAGRTYTFQAVLHIEAPQAPPLGSQARRLAFYWNTVAGSSGATLVSSDQAPNVPGDHLLRVTFTIPEDAVWCRLHAYNGAAVDGGDVWWDSFLLTEGEYDGPYFDGSVGSGTYNPEYVYTWSGSPHASTSNMLRVLNPSDYVYLSSPDQTIPNLTFMPSGPNGEGVILDLIGLGTITLAGVMAQVLPEGERPNIKKFLSGAGHSGVDFKPNGVSVTGYSAPQAIDYQSLTAEFIEVGEWRQ